MQISNWCGGYLPPLMRTTLLKRYLPFAKPHLGVRIKTFKQFHAMSSARSLARTTPTFSSAVSRRREYFFNEALKILERDLSDINVSEDESRFDLDPAIDLMDRALECSPETPLSSREENLRELAYIRYQKGLLLSQMGLYDDAASEFDRSISIDSQRDQPGRYADVFYQKALALSWLGRIPESIEGFKSALNLDPSNTSIWVDKGRLHLAQGDVEDAIQCFSKAADLDICNSQVLRELARANAVKGDFKAAVNWYDRYLACHPEDVDCLLEKANAVFEDNPQHNLGYALLTVDGAIEKAPRNASCWTTKAALLASSNRPVEALECWNKVLEIDSKNKDALIQKANVLYRLGRYAEALDSCRDAVSQGIDSETSGAGKFIDAVQRKLQNG